MRTAAYNDDVASGLRSTSVVAKRASQALSNAAGARMCQGTFFIPWKSERVEIVGVPVKIITQGIVIVFNYIIAKCYLFEDEFRKSLRKLYK